MLRRPPDERQCYIFSEQVPRRPGTVWEELPAPAPPLTADQADMLACLFSVQTRAPLRTTGKACVVADTAACTLGSHAGTYISPDDQQCIW